MNNIDEFVASLPTGIYYPEYIPVHQIVAELPIIIIFLNDFAVCQLFACLKNSCVVNELSADRNCDIVGKKMATALLRNLNYVSSIGVELINSKLSKDEILEIIKTNVGFIDVDSMTSGFRIIVNSKEFYLIDGKIFKNE